jgi:hypothetical protein
MAEDREIDRHPLSAPCRATRTDGTVVVMYVGWAIVCDWPYKTIDEPTPDEREAARQDAMEGRVDANRKALQAWLLSRTR